MFGETRHDSKGPRSFQGPQQLGAGVGSRQSLIKAGSQVQWLQALFPSASSSHFEGRTSVSPSLYWGRGLRKHEDLEEKGAREDFVSLKCKQTC